MTMDARRRTDRRAAFRAGFLSGLGMFPRVRRPRTEEQLVAAAIDRIAYAMQRVEAAEWRQQLRQDESESRSA